MEPLSIAGSIFGLLAAGAQLVPKLYNLASTIRDAAGHAEAAALELSDLEIVLTQLQNYIDGTAYASTQRLHLISLEHVKATLTQCVKTYSQLHSVLKGLRVNRGFKPLDQAIWLLRKDEVAELVARLQNHKSTFGLMLGILQCATLHEAECKMDKLCSMVNAVFLSNQELSMRLRKTETTAPITDVKSSSAQPAASDNLACIGQWSEVEKPTNFLSSRSSRCAPRASMEVDQSHPRGRTFEDLLHRSRVYRHAAKRLSRFSTDETRTLALSFSSTLTLGEVSNVAFCALPVYANDISNSTCYTFGMYTLPDIKEEDEEKGIWWQVAKLKASPTPRKFNRRATQLGILTPPDSLRSNSSASNRSIRMVHVVICIANSNGISHVYGQFPLAVQECQQFLNEKVNDVKSRFPVANTFTTLRTLQGHFGNNWKFGSKIQWSGYTVRNVRVLLSRYCSIFRNAYEPFSDRRPVASQGPNYRLIGSKLPRQSRHLLLHIIDILGEFTGTHDFEPASFITSHHTQTETLPHNALPGDNSDAVIFLIENRDKFMFGVSAADE